jgi:predicted dehydrogenase
VTGPAAAGRAAPPLRVALLGYGLGGSAFHAPLIATTPGLTLAAIVTGDPARQAAARADHPGAEIVDSAEALWTRADTLDLVVVSTPNRTHAPLGSAALGMGLHVVVDKPMAVTAAEGRELAEAARTAGRRLIPYQNRRWDGDFRTVQALLADGSLGTVHRFESRFDRWRPAPRPGWREQGDPGEGGGLLYDIGSHLIDQALVLFGPVRHVYAELDRRRPGVAVDDDVFLALTHESGVRTELHTSVLAAQAAPRFRVAGDRASYVKWGLDVQEAALRGGARPDAGAWGEEEPAQWGTLGRDGDTTPVPTRPGAYPAYYAAVAATIRGEAPPPVTPEEAIATLEVIEAAQRSAAARQVIAMR